MTKKTKIMAVGDIHGDKTLAKKLAKEAKEKNVDLVILAGDLTFVEQSIEDIIGPFAKNGKEVLIMPGNHESPATINVLEELYSNARNIHGHSFVKNNVGFFGAGGADIGPFSIPDSKIGKLIEKSYKELERKDLSKKIMITHMHPAGSKSEFSGFLGSPAIRKAIEKFKPDIAINGHIHEAGGIEEKIGKTRVINVARKPKIFEV